MNYELGLSELREIFVHQNTILKESIEQIQRSPRGTQTLLQRAKDKLIQYEKQLHTREEKIKEYRFRLKEKDNRISNLKNIIQKKQLMIQQMNQKSIMVSQQMELLKTELAQIRPSKFTKNRMPSLEGNLNRRQSRDYSPKVKKVIEFFDEVKQNSKIIKQERISEYAIDSQRMFGSSLMAENMQNLQLNLIQKQYVQQKQTEVQDIINFLNQTENYNQIQQINNLQKIQNQIEEINNNQKVKKVVTLNKKGFVLPIMKYRVDYDTQVANLQEQNKALRDEIDQYKNQIMNKRLIIQKNNSIILQTNNKLEQKCEQIAKIQLKMQQQQNRFVLKQKELKQKIQQITQISLKQQKKLLDQINEKKQQIWVLQKQLTDIQEQMNKIGNELSESKDKNEQMQGYLISCQEQFQVISKEYDSQLVRQYEQHLQLRQNLIDKNDELQKQKAELLQKNKEINEQLEQYIQKIEVAEKMLIKYNKIERQWMIEEEVLKKDLTLFKVQLEAVKKYCKHMQQTICLSTKSIPQNDLQIQEINKNDIQYVLHKLEEQKIIKPENTTTATIFTHLQLNESQESNACSAFSYKNVKQQQNKQQQKRHNFNEQLKKQKNKQQIIEMQSKINELLRQIESYKLINKQMSENLQKSKRQVRANQQIKSRLKQQKINLQLLLFKNEQKSQAGDRPRRLSSAQIKSKLKNLQSETGRKRGRDSFQFKSLNGKTMKIFQGKNHRVSQKSNQQTSKDLVTQNVIIAQMQHQDSKISINKHQEIKNNIYIPRQDSILQPNNQINFIKSKKITVSFKDMQKEAIQRRASVGNIKINQRVPRSITKRQQILTHELVRNIRLNTMFKSTNQVNQKKSLQGLPASQHFTFQAKKSSILDEKNVLEKNFKTDDKILQAGQEVKKLLSNNSFKIFLQYNQIIAFSPPYKFFIANYCQTQLLNDDNKYFKDEKQFFQEDKIEMRSNIEQNKIKNMFINQLPPPKVLNYIQQYEDLAPQSPYQKIKNLQVLMSNNQQQKNEQILHKQEQSSFDLNQCLIKGSTLFKNQFQLNKQNSQSKEDQNLFQRLADSNKKQINCQFQNNFSNAQNQKILPLISYVTQQLILQNPLNVIQQKVESFCQTQEICLFLNPTQHNLNTFCIKSSNQKQIKNNFADYSQQTSAQLFLSSEVQFLAFTELPTQSVSNSSLFQLKRHINQTLSLRESESKQFIQMHRNQFSIILNNCVVAADNQTVLSLLSKQFCKQEVEQIYQRQISKKQHQILRVFLENIEQKPASRISENNSNIVSKEIQKIYETVYKHSSKLSQAILTHLILILQATEDPLFYQNIKKLFKIIKKYQQSVFNKLENSNMKPYCSQLN